MVEVRIDSNSKMVRNELGRMISQIPEVEEEFAEELMEIAVDEIGKSADKRFNDFSGNMKNEISMRNVNKVNTDDGVKLNLNMKGETDSGADYLAWHEYADSGHWVSVDSNNSPIKKWADENMTENPDFLYVRPTPFVKPAIQRIASRARRKAESPDNRVAQFATVR